MIDQFHSYLNSLKYLEKKGCKQTKYDVFINIINMALEAIAQHLQQWRNLFNMWNMEQHSCWSTSTVSMIIDLSKAFDTINHVKLLEKCEHYGLRSITKLCLKRYLNERLQFIRIDHLNSQLETTAWTLTRFGLGPKIIHTLNNIFSVSTMFIYFVCRWHQYILFR